MEIGTSDTGDSKPQMRRNGHSASHKTLRDATTLPAATQPPRSIRKPTIARGTTTTLHMIPLSLSPSLFISHLSGIDLESIPSSTSVLRFLSCASSSSTTLYLRSSRSEVISCSKTPSVMNLTLVSCPTPDAS